ncbi:hypothetical protein DKX38_022366 [Salix brachista]|uniref:Uncharacterized protein n=1 Tax=Salix brachista TaxID=2182728 RepID=A0A5N5KB78_9ROSI|nr:hypothetical protein DKX38_022366 [Salix brachista]
MFMFVFVDAHILLGMPALVMWSSSRISFFAVEKQIVIANPDINNVCLSFFVIMVLFFSPTSNLILNLHQVELCDDDDFPVLACDGISV